MPGIRYVAEQISSWPPMTSAIRPYHDLEHQGIRTMEEFHRVRW
jgi:hypothetical protein